MQGPIRLLIADDHPIVRLDLRTYFESVDDIEIVGEAGDGRAAVDLAARLRPHVILMDYEMPGLNGVEATLHVARHDPEVRIVGFTLFDEATCDEICAAGAITCVAKGSELEVVAEAVRFAAESPTREQRWFPPEKG
ncbi:MAG: response regulator transcription factor [Planctomycetes bacterium]|nr:response regulator transcription factor [Planctomycetota bacterium]